MKQTPIPEKIKTKEIDETWKFIVNALIDVLTEQQKEIESIKKDFKTHEHAINNGQPSTAMRSTGEVLNDIKPAPGAFMPNFSRTDIKPQEDGDLVSNCCAWKFTACGYEKEEGIWQERCNHCGKLCEPIYMSKKDIKNIYRCIDWNAENK